MHKIPKITFLPKIELTLWIVKKWLDLWGHECKENSFGYKLGQRNPILVTDKEAVPPTLCTYKQAYEKIYGPLIERFMGPTWGPVGVDRTQVGPILTQWTLLSGSNLLLTWSFINKRLYIRAASRYAPSQWETALLCKDISHWLGASLESALYAIWQW